MTIADHLLSLLPPLKASAWRKARKQTPEYQQDGHSVFVYGSLKRGFQNNDVLAQSDFVALTRTLSAHYLMISMGAFPGIILSPGGEHHVGGEVYQVNGETLWTLDIMEGHGEFFVRKKTRVEGIEEKVWYYVLCGPDHTSFNIPNCPLIWLDAESNTQKWILPLDSSEFLEEN